MSGRRPASSKKGDLARHNGPFWAVDSHGIQAYKAILRSLEAVETSTPYDWGDADSAAFRIGLTAASQEALDELDLQSDGMEFASEMVLDAAAKGLRIEEVPITYHERQGEATLRSFRDGWRHVKFMLVNAPGYLFSVPGAALTVAGVALMVLTFFDISFTAPTGRTFQFGVRTMVAGSLLAIVGYQIACLGIFATMASDPLRLPSDRLTRTIVDRLSLEAGPTVGLTVLAFGAAYATYLVQTWLAARYSAMPVVTHDIVAFTAIVLGVQTVFGSFVLSAIFSRTDLQLLD